MPISSHAEEKPLKDHERDHSGIPVPDAHEEALIHSLIGEISQLRSEVGDLHRNIKQILAWQEPLWTTEQLAQLLSRKPATIRTWVREGKITAIAMPGEKTSYIFNAKRVMEELNRYSTHH